MKLIMSISFSTNNLITLLDQIKLGIEDGLLDKTTQENLWTALTWDKKTENNKKMSQYLFTGWWLLEGQNLNTQNHDFFSINQ